MEDDTTTNLKTILAEALGNAKVPFNVHLKIVKELRKALDEHRQVAEAHQRSLSEFQGQIDNHNDIVRNYSQEIERVRNMAKGEPGENYVLTNKDKKEIAQSIPPKIVEKVIERTEVIKEKPIITEKFIEKDINKEKLFKEFINFIKEKKPLNSGDINGMQGFSKDGINYRFEELMHGGGGGSSNVSIVYSVDLSSQANGSNKVFTVPSNDAFISLSGTDSPFIYRPTVDFTGTGTTTLTLTSAVNAPSSGATLILTYKATP